jgi:peptidoglycan hydrolase CwlO-like protein
MISIEEFEELKEDIEARKAEVERKKGELKGLMDSLAEEFGCKTLEEAQALLEKLEAQEKTLHARADAKAEELKAAWDRYCEEVKNGNRQGD